MTPGGGGLATGTLATFELAVAAASIPVASVFGIAAGGNLQNETSIVLNQDLDLIASTGAKWLRFDINWAQIQAGGSGSYNWANIDAVVNGAVARGLIPHGNILYTPAWINASAIVFPTPAQYAAFCTAAVTHYAPLGVHSYEMWNEPNVTSSCSAPNPATYTSLIIAAYSAIKTADPSATVVTAGLAPSATAGGNFEPTDFLTGIYAAGGSGHFDAVGAHPYCQPDQPGATDAWSAWFKMTGAATSLRSIMVANGDTAKKIWATEYGSSTYTGGDGFGFTETQQAASVTLAYQLWQTYPFAGPLFWYQHRDAAVNTTDIGSNYGLVRNNLVPKLSFAAYQTAAGVGPPTPIGPPIIGNAPQIAAMAVSGSTAAATVTAGSTPAPGVPLLGMLGTVPLADFAFAAPSIPPGPLPNLTLAAATISGTSVMLTVPPNLPASARTSGAATLLVGTPITRPFIVMAAVSRSTAAATVGVPGVIRGPVETLPSHAKITLYTSTATVSYASRASIAPYSSSGAVEISNDPLVFA